MSLSERVAKLYKSRDMGRRVAREYLRKVLSMSIADAKETLGFSKGDSPSDSEVNNAYRQKYINNRRLHPDRGGDPALAVALNVAKDTLLGVLKPDRGDPEAYSRSRNPNNPPGGWREEDHYKPNKEPVPPPPGGPFQSAVPTNVDWKILASPSYKSDYIPEEGSEGGYWETFNTWVLVGVSATDYVFLKLVQTVRSRRTSGSKPASAWTSETSHASLKSDILKIGPKAIDNLRGKFPGKKFMVLESKPSEAMVEKARPTLSFKDAAIGSGLASAEKGRKAQVELEPVLDKDRWKSMSRDERVKSSHLAYDWFVYVNGRKTQLDEKEVQGMSKNHLLFALYSYDYSKKVNLTRLRGGTLKLDGKTAIRLLAEAMNPGSLKNQLEEISNAL